VKEEAAPLKWIGVGNNGSSRTHAKPMIGELL